MRVRLRQEEPKTESHPATSSIPVDNQKKSDIEVRLSPRLKQGFGVELSMAEAILSFKSVQHRHAIPAPKLTRPWAKRAGPGIVGVSIDLYEGAVLGLIGPNGAGKTTLLRLMAGVLPLQEGQIQTRFEGTSWQEVPDLRHWVGHMPRTSSLARTLNRGSSPNPIGRNARHDGEENRAVVGPCRPP